MMRGAALILWGLGSALGQLCKCLGLVLCPCSAQIRWLLDDEIVSALRHSQVISTSILHRVATHIYNSKGRPSCHSEVVLLQFVFGPEHSLEKFKEVKRKP